MNTVDHAAMNQCLFQPIFFYKGQLYQVTQEPHLVECSLGYSGAEIIIKRGLDSL